MVLAREKNLCFGLLSHVEMPRCHLIFTTFHIFDANVEKIVKGYSKNFRYSSTLFNFTYYSGSL
ncbi:CLUMA_CG017517, isoform A [Clunio marinus]|uniref:CLUMA_CG017517, isoform A n=1 Tax=Clunio marinus TaxID=568069 RepID=A0A1J1IWF4_9DIPT|nr:CLUMA_CG017517, isoform A [Clunio marinus]